MASYDVPVRSDRWQGAGAGPLTVDAGGATIEMCFAAANPGPNVAASAVVISGPDESRFSSYAGTDPVWLRLASTRSNEPIMVTVVKEGATGAPVTPYLPNVALATDADTTLTGAAGALLAGFEGDATDTAPTITAAVDAAGAFTIGTAKNLAVGGSLTINANGGYVFNPAGDFAALKADATAAIGTVTVTATGNTTGLTTAFTLDATVAGVNDGPTAVNDTAATANNVAKVGNFLTDGIDDSHPQAEDLWVSKINGAFFAGGLPIKLASGATISVNGVTGAWTYQPNGRAAGSEVITYTLVDRWGATATGTLTITVSAP